MYHESFALAESFRFVVEYAKIHQTGSSARFPELGGHGIGCFRIRSSELQAHVSWPHRTQHTVNGSGKHPASPATFATWLLRFVGSFQENSGRCSG